MKPGLKFEISWNQETSISHTSKFKLTIATASYIQTAPSSFPFQKDLSDPRLLSTQKNILRNQRLRIANREALSFPCPPISSRLGSTDLAHHQEEAPPESAH
jgi:hypothetical protein